MFKAIKTFIQNARVSIDYPRYESERRKAHLAQAELRFDASELTRQAAQIRSQANIAGEQKFAGDLNRLRRQLSATETELQKINNCYRFLKGTTRLSLMICTRRKTVS